MMEMGVRTRKCVGGRTVKGCDNSRNRDAPNKQTRQRRGKISTGRFIPGLISFNAGFYLSFYLVCIVESLEPPEIIPSGRNASVDALILNHGENLELICYGDEPLTWNGTNKNDWQSDPRVSITSSTSGTSRPYMSTLTITDISYTDGDHYLCSYTGRIPNNTEESLEVETNVFVHVQVIDEDHLLVLEKQFIQGYAGDDVVVPCIPTRPGVKIEMFHDNKPIPLDGINYSRSRGYSIRQIKQMHHGMYSCRATFNGKKDERSFTVYVIGNSGSLSYPSISAPWGVATGADFAAQCFTEQEGHFTLEIEAPQEHNDTRVSVSNLYGKSTKNGKTFKSWTIRYHVKGAVPSDTGIYTCTVKRTSKEQIRRSKPKQITVYDEGESYLQVMTSSENIIASKGTPARWVINITSFPPNYNFTWRDNQGDVIDLRNRRFTVSNRTENDWTLEISDVNLLDDGPYPFSVEIPGTDESETLNLSLTVKASPKVEIKTNGPKSNFLENETYKLYCHVSGYPLPSVNWKYQKCQDALQCEESKEVVGNMTSVTKNGLVSEIEFTAKSHGKYYCYASNRRNSSSAKKTIRIVDYHEDSESDIFVGIPEEVVEGDDVELVCSLSKFNHSESDLIWMRDVNGERHPADKNMVESNDTTWSWKKILTIKSIQKSEGGRYVCENDDGSFLNTIADVTVIAMAAPKLLNSNLNNSKVSLRQGDSINLTCLAEGKPKPEIIWTWDDHPEKDWPKDIFRQTYYFSNENTVLHLKSVLYDSQGRFMCKATNRNGTISAYLDIAVTGTRIFTPIAVAIILVLFLVVIIFGVWVARYKYKQGELNRFLKEISQKDFYEGAVENINPELSVAEQAYLLPYDMRREFPKDRLKLGIQLGSGAFGRVVKADALGILDTEPITTVAVKMVKPNADESHFKALMSELKIMVNLGQHINVVNMLGACTKNLAKKKELFVIVEYCKYGSLLSYMHRNKRTFINQLDPSRGSIDPTIDRDSEQSQLPRIHYAQLTFTDPGNSRKPASNGYRTLDEFNEPIVVDDPPTPTLRPIEGGATRDIGYPSSSHVDFLTPDRRSTEHYVSESQAESACTGITVMTTDGTTKRRSSCGSQWQDHYRGDYQARDVKPIRTTDLLCWAFQIARGMEYLASRKVLHGDLAARNVLLAENNVVKICDFGLAKEMYKDYKYKKKSEGVLLPVKWMAIESIYFGVFSTQSDCWSFGVVLWELFTLGKTPYPGMEADERFYKRISEGYRMEKPPLAPSCVYDIMLECWSQEPIDRPTFPALVDRIGDMMEEGLRNHYVDLNSPYMKINQTNMVGRTDYLSQMGRSEFASDSTRPSPDRQYQNLPDGEDSAGYLNPIRPVVAPTGAEEVLPPTYQNIQPQLSEPSCSMLANNSGYMFVKAPAEVQNADPPKCTVQIRYSPDIKDMYGLREDSTSPERYPFNNGESAVDVNHIELQLGNDGIRGVDNMNYVPSHLLFTKAHTNGSVPSTAAEINRKSTESGGGRRQKRQKNDSGLGSIDSNQFDSQHASSIGPEIQEHCGDFSHRQQPNGYVSHQNISSFS